MAMPARFLGHVLTQFRWSGQEERALLVIANNWKQCVVCRWRRHNKSQPLLPLLLLLLLPLSIGNRSWWVGKRAENGWENDRKESTRRQLMCMCGGQKQNRANESWTWNWTQLNSCLARVVCWPGLSATGGFRGGITNCAAPLDPFHRKTTPLRHPPCNPFDLLITPEEAHEGKPNGRISSLDGMDCEVWASAALCQQPLVFIIAANCRLKTCVPAGASGQTTRATYDDVSVISMGWECQARAWNRLHH